MRALALGPRLRGDDEPGAVLYTDFRKEVLGRVVNYCEGTRKTSRGRGIDRKKSLLRQDFV